MYKRGTDEARWATEEYNALQAEQARLNEQGAVATREQAEERLGNARAIREETAAMLEQQRAMLQYQYDQLRNPAPTGAMRQEIMDQSALRRIRELQANIADIEGRRSENLAEIARL